MHLAIYIHRKLIRGQALMRGFSKLDGTPYAVRLDLSTSCSEHEIDATQISTPMANFLSGGLASFVYWIMAIPADNIKKSVLPQLACVYSTHIQ